MSESVRQSNLFAAEDYKKIFKAYQFIDYTAYDFDTLKQALINYIQAYYPEDFNDYIESSEFIAIIELIAYLGTSLAFRTDLNSRENFIDTAERRESIIRLAQMVNYVPRRNIPASGLFKIAAVQTSQSLTDANGVSITDVPVYWNDPNNPDWFDQFVQICNAAFSSLNPFGRPTKSGTIGSIPTDLYQLNNVLRLNVTYPTVISVNGQQYPIDVCNPDFVTNETIFERDPNPLSPFNFIYRNDSLGVASSNTGFFLYFKQGTLTNIDSNFDFPVPNRVFPVTIQNINQDDVYVQEIDQNGNVLAKWKKVPALAGENIIYNSIQFAERNIFDVLSGANDTISIRYADGNFGNIPTGLFRTWIRTSANQNLVIRPTDAQGLQIDIPYIGSDQQQYNLRVIFNLEQTIGNAAPSETNEQIKLRAPEVFSTQSRMVNGSDYNVLPLVYGNQIAKVQAVDRTYSGQSRYIDLNDPTGFHRDLIIFGQDGALFRDNQNVLQEVIKDSSNSTSVDVILVNTIQEMLRDKKVSQFFYDEYLPQFEKTIRVNKNSTPGPYYKPDGYSLLEIGNPNQNQLYWVTSPLKNKNSTGFFSLSPTSNSSTDPSLVPPLVNSFDTNNTTHGDYESWGFITGNSVVQFVKQGHEDTLETLNSAPVNSVIQSGLPLVVNPLNPYKNVGPVELAVEEQNHYHAIKVFPAFRNELTDVEIAEITAAIAAGISFWIYYDVLTNEWHTSTAATPGITDQATQPFVYPPPIYNYVEGVQEIYSDWASHPASGLLYVNIASSNQVTTATYDLTARGRVYVFESYRDVRFYWEPNQIVIDSASGQALQDTIEIMPFVNSNSSVNNNEPVIVDPATSYLKSQVDFNITGIYTQDDGYTNTSKVQVSLIDANGDSIPDDPDAFNKIVGSSDRVVFEYYSDEVTGYQTTRPWVCMWGDNLVDITTDYYVYFPVATSGDTSLYGSPLISNIPLNDPLDPETTQGAIVTYLSDADLIFINNLAQLSFTSNTPTARTIANQVTAFFNGTDCQTPGVFSTFTWLNGTYSVVNKSAIVNNYFLSKSFLVNPEDPPGYGVYYSLAFESTSDTLSYPTNKWIKEYLDKYHFDKNGKVFTQNTNIASNDKIPLYFKWSHYSPLDQRVDPSATNIIDMIVITNAYYADVISWKNANGSASTLPAPPTTEELRVQFQGLNQYKMLSDNMIWNSGKFKLLFGQQAATELQATFKVVKAPSTSISDNEVKTKVIQAIDIYFNIRNWDFGEKFFYTELAAFIHQQLSKIISSVVIVPNNANSQFGDLFEIVAQPDELFLSTATVNNVQIVANLTEQNLRI